MKAPSLLLTASVIGAVALGGAVTGATVASFTDSSPIPAEPLRTGSLKLTTGAKPGTAVGLAPDSSRDLTVTLTEEAEGKNLFTRRIVDDVVVTGLPPEAVRVEFRERRPNDQSACTSSAFADWARDSQGRGQQRQLVLGTRGRPSPASEVCIRLTLSEDAESLLGVGTASGNVQVTFTSQQVQGDDVAGWVSSAAPVTIPVTATIAPSAPASVACSISGASNNPMIHLAWQTMPGVEKFRLSRIWADGDRRSFDMASTYAFRGTTHWVAPLTALLTDRDHAFMQGQASGDWGNRLVVQAYQAGLWSSDSPVVTVNYRVTNGSVVFSCLP